MFSRLRRSETELFSTDWLGIFETDDKTYTYCKEVKTWNSTKVAVLPYTIKNEKYYFLSVVERIHPYLPPQNCSITGKIDLIDAEKLEQTAIRELEEEAGFYAEEKDLIYLGECYPSKSMDTKFECFAIHLNDVEIGEAYGDGTTEEEEAYTQWIDETTIGKIHDPIFYFMTYQLKMRGENNF